MARIYELILFLNSKLPNSGMGEENGWSHVTWLSILLKWKKKSKKMRDLMHLDDLCNTVEIPFY